MPKNHVSRSPKDTYYQDENTVLRPHTSAHQIEMIKKGFNSFIVFGDVYWWDAIDATHYPAFHQMEGVRIYDWKDIGASNQQ